MSDSKLKYYQALEVEPTATLNEIKTSYRNLSLKYHPDKQKGKSEAEKHEAEEKIKEINPAYEILSDPEKRMIYDFWGEYFPGLERKKKELLETLRIEKEWNKFFNGGVLIYGFALILICAYYDLKKGKKATNSGLSQKENEKNRNYHWKWWWINFLAMIILPFLVVVVWVLFFTLISPYWIERMLNKHRDKVFKELLEEGYHLDSRRTNNLGVIKEARFIESENDYKQKLRATEFAWTLKSTFLVGGIIAITFFVLAIRHLIKWVILAKRVQKKKAKILFFLRLCWSLVLCFLFSSLVFLVWFSPLTSKEILLPTNYAKAEILVN